MGVMIEELEKQHLSVLAMWKGLAEACPEDLWLKPTGTAPFWHEAYHCLFWLHNFVGNETKALVKEPFGVGIDPRLFKQPKISMDKAAALGYADWTQEWIRSVFATLSEEALTAKDTFENGEFDTVFQRLLYGLRHAQHHVGKLSATLAARDIHAANWK